MKQLRILCSLLACGSFLVQAQAQERPSLIAHEWGTFTSLQDEVGNAIGGINTDDEPLPSFTHDLVPSLIAKPNAEGAPRCHPDVTMRLETPVIYFHSKGQGQGHWKEPVDVHVDFHGGWLTQFYPLASHPPLATGMQHILTNTSSSLEWAKLRLGGDGEGPVTKARVWTAPRAVDAMMVTTPDGEKEKFLFYRGVGNLDSPLRVVRTGSALQIQGQLGFEISQPTRIDALWLVEIREGGRCAFRALPPLTVENQKATPIAASSEFAESDFSTENLGRLKNAMHAALMKNGLYQDEASAVLNTWESSYFENSGLRLFYIVPNEWTNHYLPLKISGASEITRVMVGRIELLSRHQRELLSRLSTQPKLADYFALGRFRSALLLNEQKRRPTPVLKKFISSNVQIISLPSLQVAGKSGSPQ